MERPNTNSGLVDTGKLPECNGAKKIPAKHEKIIFRVLLVSLESSIQRHPFISSSKLEKHCEHVLLILLEHMSISCCSGPPTSITLLFTIETHVSDKNV